MELISPSSKIRQFLPTDDQAVISDAVNVLVHPAKKAKMDKKQTLPVFNPDTPSSDTQTPLQTSAKKLTPVRQDDFKNPLMDNSVGSSNSQSSPSPIITPIRSAYRPRFQQQRFRPRQFSPNYQNIRPRPNFQNPRFQQSNQQTPAAPTPQSFNLQQLAANPEQLQNILTLANALTNLQAPRT